MIVWIDCEVFLPSPKTKYPLKKMTGLDVDRDVLLEIAVLLTTDTLDRIIPVLLV